MPAGPHPCPVTYTPPVASRCSTAYQKHGGLTVPTSITWQPIRRSAAAKGGEHAECAAGKTGEHDGAAGELERVRQRRHDFSEHRPPRRDRRAEIAGQDAAEPAQILHRPRLVEPIGLPDLCSDGRRRVVGNERALRPAGSEINERR